MTYSEGEECKYTATLSNGATAEYTTYAMCGFNKESDAYCPAFKGDLQYRLYWSEFLRALNDSDASANCHLESKGIDWRNGCQALHEELPDDFWLQKKRAEWVVSSERAYPFVANNDECVKKVATHRCWQPS